MSTNGSNTATKAFEKWMNQETGVTKSMVENSPAFEMTRQNNAEFKTAQQYAAIVRRCISQEFNISLTQRNKLNQFSKRILAILQKDTSSNRGERFIGVNNKDLVAKIALNYSGKNPMTLESQINTNFNLVFESESVSLQIGNVGVNDISWAKGATHLKVKLVILCIPSLNNFGLNAKADIPQVPEYKIVTAEELVPKGEESLNLDQISIEADLQSAITTGYMEQMAFASIEFFQEVNGEMYHMSATSSNAIVLMGVHGF